MGTDSSDEHVISIINQVLGCDARLDVRRRVVHNVFHSLLGTDVFHCHFQCRKILDQRFHDFFDKDGFPFENIGVCDLRMNAEHHSHLLHRFQNRVQIFDVRDTEGGVGRGTRGVVLASDDSGSPVGVFQCGSLSDFFRFGTVGEIERHEGLEVRWILPVLGKRGHDALLVFQGKLDSGDGRLQIRHHQTSTESRVCVFQDGCGGRTISAMVVEIVGVTNGDRLVVGHARRSCLLFVFVFWELIVKFGWGYQSL
mmetsp:Transcript_17272/g.39725  ORF Transcript_17272/g.39725 Transcript_17272/m.39725 type:complete len:254 (-) Transcript_17272:5-766(-)